MTPTPDLATRPSSRLAFPRFGTRLIPRPRLLQAMRECESATVICLHAPAGYGKTVLLYQWFEQLRATGQAVAWLSLDDAHRDAHALNVALEDAMTSARHESGPALFGEKPETSSGENGRCVAPLTLILDGLECAMPGPVTDWIRQYILDPPAACQLVLSTRSIDGLRLARARVSGLVRVVPSACMEMDEIETRALFEAHDRTPPSDRVRTWFKGWPTGLAAVASADPRTCPAEPSLLVLARLDRIRDYVQEEVIERLDEPARSEFLMLSLADPLDSTAVDFLLKSQRGRALLDLAVRRGLFIDPEPANPEHYKMVPVIRECLLRYLQTREPQRFEQEAQRAADWHAARGFVINAVQLASRISDHERSARAIEVCGGATLYSRIGMDAFERCMRLIPENIIQQYPRLQLCGVISRFKHGSVETALSEYQLIADQTAGFEHDRDGGDNESLQREAELVRSVLEVSFQIALPPPLESRNRDLNLPLDRANMHVMQGVKMQRAGNLQAAEAQFTESIPLYRTLGSVYGETWVRIHFAFISFLKGNLGEADRRARQVLSQTQDVTGVRALTALAQSILAAVQYERGQISSAQSLLNQALEAMEHDEVVFDEYALISFVQQRLLLWFKDSARAMAEIDKLERSRLFPYSSAMTNLSATWRVEALTMAGKLPEAESLIERSGMRQIAKEGETWWEKDTAELAIAAMDNRAGRHEEVLRRLETCMEGEPIECRRSFLIRMVLERALALDCLNRSPAATETIVYALELAQPGGYISPFHEGGEIIAMSLASVVRWLREERGPADDLSRFAQRIQSSYPRGETSVSLIFTPRERQVLVELNRGLTNKAIASRLHLSENTIKTHLKRTFRKLKVRSRQEAVAEIKRRWSQMSPTGTAGE